MKRKTTIAAALAMATALLAGCQTAAQREAQVMVQNGQDASAKFKACNLAVYNSPDYAILRKYVSFDTPPTLDQLTDSNMATDAEIAAIKLTHPRYVACRTAFMSQLNQTAPGAVVIWADFFNKGEESLIELIQHKKSWGQHLTYVRDLGTIFQAKLMEESRRVAAGLEQSNEAELARRQRAADAMMRFYQNQELINSMNRPVMTNCTSLGYTTNCISQ